jgi:hypothetical protein
MELRADFTAIQKDRGENAGEHDGELIYKDADRKNVNLRVKLTVRGNFRRNPVNCDFPPLSVNFKKGELKNTLFENQDKLKLVTPCQSDEYVIEEYLVYKMYNLVTDMSLKVRLVRITYFDTSTNKELSGQYSFFIEDKDHAAKRNNASVKDNFLTPFDVNRDNLNKMSAFQYIIGNKDWFVSSRKNIIIMQPNDTSQAPFAVPYDFDFSALVNADYTKPKNQIHIFPETRRIYKGICFTDAEYEDVFGFYRELRPAFLSIIRKQPNISAEATNQITDYIDQFYSATKNSKSLIREFKAVCETKKTYNIPEL